MRRGLHSAIVIVLATALCALSQCLTNTSARVDCGYAGITQQQCVSKGCCWSPVNPNPNNYPWCFYQGQPVCNPNATRNDCGYVGITPQQCQANGCCWSPVNPNPNNLPWCFYQTTPPAVWSATGIAPLAGGGFSATLVVNGTGATPYGPMISPLSILVQPLDANTVRIYMKDAYNARWEVPQYLLPFPQYPPLPATLNVNISYVQSPFSVLVTRVSDGQVLFDTSVDQLIFTDMYLQISNRLAAQSPNVYGLGEHRDPLQLDTTNHKYTMWTRDAPTPVDQNEYGSHPFYMELISGSGSAHGVFLRSSNGMDVILNPGSIQYRVIGGVFDFFVVAGPTPAAVVQQFHSVIGNSHMPPFWALGWHQCRYGMPNLQYVEQVVANYSAAQIPLEVMWNDIDYMNQYMDFTFDPVNYPAAQVKQFVQQLHNDNQFYVVITDPGIHNQAGYKAYDDGESANIFVKQSDGQTDYVGQVWPGSTVFPDFMNPKTTAYWQEQIEYFMGIVPIDGLWIDMNEVSNFVNGNPSSNSKYNNPPYNINNCGSNAPLNTRTLPMDAVHTLADGSRAAEYNTHNLYGFAEGIATRTALENISGQRAFVLSRSTFSGSGSHVAHWTGDNYATFDSMHSSVIQVMNHNMFGIPLVGADICGFLGDTTEELCGRWTALGAFYPFSRNHGDIHSDPHEPYRWASVTAIARKVIAARYSLHPYYYTLFYEAHVAGNTVARPLFFEFATDSNTYSIDTQFLIGSALMVSPVLAQGATSVSVYFPPASNWFSFWNFTQQLAVGWQTLPVSFYDIPVHVRGGSILPMQTPAMTLTDTRASPFELLVVPDLNGRAAGSLFWDDGLDLNVGANAFYATFSHMNGVLTVTVKISSFSAVPNVSFVTFLGLRSVSRVTFNGRNFSSFSFQPQTGVLQVSNLGASLLQPFTLAVSP